MSRSDLRDVSLVAVTSHEMRAPLAAIRGFVDMLQRRRHELDDADVEEFLQVIATQTERLIRLADDLVTMESLDDAPRTIELERIVLVPALERLLRELPDAARVELRVSADAPPAIASDPLRLDQVLTNLLTNALKYSDEAAPVTLEVAAAGPDRIAIAVIDHGIGIDPADRDRVFEPFYRTLEGARSADGSGLGLAIARRLVEVLGGDVVAEPTPGGGTTFRVTLPVRAAAS